MNILLKKYNLERYWFEIANRRKLLENIARENGFDPLHADGWYNFTKEKLVNQVRIIYFLYIRLCFVGVLIRKFLKGREINSCILFYIERGFNSFVS